MKLWPAILLALTLVGCGSGSNSEYVQEDENGQLYDTRTSPNGYKRPTLPASTTDDTVTYHNSHTGTTSEYDLEVDRDYEGRVERINFPNGGWLEVSGEGVDNGDGTETFHDRDGKEYTFSKFGDGHTEPDSDDEEEED